VNSNDVCRTRHARTQLYRHLRILDHPLSVTTALRLLECCERSQRDSANGNGMASLDAALELLADFTDPAYRELTVDPAAASAGTSSTNQSSLHSGCGGSGLAPHAVVVLRILAWHVEHTALDRSSNDANISASESPSSPSSSSSSSSSSSPSPPSPTSLRARMLDSISSALQANAAAFAAAESRVRGQTESSNDRHHAKRFIQSSLNIFSETMKHLHAFLLCPQIVQNSVSPPILFFPFVILSFI
jgi:hypothetical protein